jgi:MobL relaxases
MGVFFHILSTGGGSGASRITRYIAERDKDLTREGPSSRRLFSEDQDNLSYHRADRILDPHYGQPDKDDLIHFSVMIEEEEFDKLGSEEKEKQARFREAVREAMKGMAAELNVEELTWVAGIHRNSQNPHTHIVMNKAAIERGTGRPQWISRIPKRLLPHREIENGKEVIVNGPLGEKFLAALEKQQALYLHPKENQPELTPAEKWERLARKYQKEHAEPTRIEQGHDPSRPTTSRDHLQITVSWNEQAQIPNDKFIDLRIALGRRLEFEMRLAFAEVWHERAVRHGHAYRFEVVDQTTGEERKISDFDVRRRAAARATRASYADRAGRNEAIEADLADHSVTLQQLSEARETKIASLGKDVSSLRGTLTRVEEGLSKRYDMPVERELTPLLSRETLSELQQQAVKLNLTDRVSELEKLRIALAREHTAPARTDREAAALAAQVNIARAELMAGDARLENFEASVHLTNYEVAGDRWTLAALDKQIARRHEDTKLVPQRAARLDLRSLARLNYSAAGREQAALEVEQLAYVRGEIVRQIEVRRAPLIADRDLSRETLDVLENAYVTEQRSRSRNGAAMPEPKYESYQMNRLESSAETLRDPRLIKEVNDLEKIAFKDDPEINWEGRAVAREIMSGITVEETKDRLQHFLESKKVASLNLGEHRTGTLRDVEARTLTEYLARVIESREKRDHRHSITVAAREHHGRLISDFQKARDYHDAARELASEAQERNPAFNDKEKMNLEIYAERQNDAAERERYLELARSDNHSQDREVSMSQSR